MENLDKCPICHQRIKCQRFGYFICDQCEHEWKAEVSKVQIENDALDIGAILKLDGLTRKKISITKKHARSRSSLLDFGAGSGKFLYFIKNFFGKASGVEVTPSCIEFAKNELQVTLQNQIPSEKFDVITSWHSLEHIPPDLIKKLGGEIFRATGEVFILSVPNASSFAARWFGELFPYYDFRSHFHQFSDRSLENYLKEIGWEKIQFISIPVYSLFAYIQGFVNLVTGTHNFLYFSRKRGQEKVFSSKLQYLTHVVLSIFFLPASLLLVGVEIFFPRRATCLNLVCRK